MPADIVIRLLETHDELRVCEDIQREAWGMIDRDIVPMHMLVSFVHYGGVVLGAFDGDVMAGFLFGFPGLLDADDERAAWMGMRVKHCSEMLGVRPAYQSRGIGDALKREQRRRVLAQGLRLVTWTYDPLMSRNAHLNIARLGGICRMYICDAYGELHGINAGVVTDRLELEWWIASQHVRARLADSRQTVQPRRVLDWQTADDAQMVNPTEPRPGGLRAPVAFESPSAPYAVVEIPGDFQAVKQADMGLAQAWQQHIRTVLEASFAAGYVITGFSSEREGGIRRSYYILTRDIDVAALARQAYNPQAEDNDDED